MLRHHEHFFHHIWTHMTNYPWRNHPTTCTRYTIQFSRVPIGTRDQGDMYGRDESLPFTGLEREVPEIGYERLRLWSRVSQQSRRGGFLEVVYGTRDAIKPRK